MLRRLFTFFKKVNFLELLFQKPKSENLGLRCTSTTVEQCMYYVGLMRSLRWNAVVHLPRAGRQGR